MLFDLHTASRSQLRHEARVLSTLALPMMVAQIAQVATGFVDTVMAGRVSTDDLAAVSLGSSVFITFYVTMMGIVTALNPMLSHLYGAGEKQRIGDMTRQGLWFGFMLGCLAMVLMFAIQPALRSWLSLPADVEDKVMIYISGAAIGMPAAMMHRALHAFASSVGRTRPIMLVSLLALALNIPLNYIFIHGLFGMPAMGGAGCGLATGIVMCFNAFALYSYLKRQPDLKPYGLTREFSKPQWHTFPAMLKLGIPIGLSFFVEVSLFSFIALLIAKLGTLVVASHQAVLNFSSLVYMIPQSIATALSIRTGQSIGAGDYRLARLICGIGLVLAVAAASITMLLVLLFREQIMAMYSADPAVIALGSGLMLFAAFYQLTDAMQTVASGGLRGYKITTLPMFIHIVSFWGLGLLLGSVLGLTDWLRPAMGVHGFWTALVISLSAAGLALVGYLSHVSRQRLHRQTARG